MSGALVLDDYHDCKINIHTLSERLVQSDYDDGWKFRIAPTEDNMANIRKHEDDVGVDNGECDVELMKG